MNHIALVAIGAVAGSVGTKILTSKPARKVYVNSIVAGMLMRDGVGKVVEEAKAQFDDVCAEAEHEISRRKNEEKINRKGSKE